MANTLLTIDMITREAVDLFTNTNAFIMELDRQYDDQFAVSGAKIGDTVRIRLPNDYVVQDGPAIGPQDTTEQNTSLTLAYQKVVPLAFTSKDRTLSLDDFSKRILAPAINNLAGKVALTIMGGVEGGVCNFVSLLDNSGNITTPTAATFLSAQATLATNSAPTGSRRVVNDPFTDARVTDSLKGLFNPATEISRQYTSGAMKNALGFSWMSDQTVLKHTAGTFTAGTVAGAGQTGTTLVTNAITGTLKAGDIITLTAVHAVNRVTKQSTGTARQFVLTADAASGATSLSIYPAIVPAVNGADVQYQTVDASPADGATITLATKASEVYRKNIAFAPEAITMATADLELPSKAVVEASRATFDGISMRMVSDYITMTDQWVTRLDVLFGYRYVRPEWAVIVADSI